MSITATHTRFTSKLHEIVLTVFINGLHLYTSLDTIQPHLLCLNNVVNVLLALILLLSSRHRRHRIAINTTVDIPEETLLQQYKAGQGGQYIDI
jgi:hypothetical protein